MRNGRGGGGRIPFGHRDTDVHGGGPGFEHGHRAKDDPDRAGRRDAGKAVGGVQRGRAKGRPGRQRYDQPLRDGQWRVDVQPADDAGDQRRQLRDGDGGRLEPAAGHVHSHGNGAGTAVCRRARPADGDGRRTVGRRTAGGRCRRAHTVRRHPGVQAGHGFRGVRTAPRGGRRRTAARGRRVQRRGAHTQPGRQRGSVSRQFGRFAHGKPAAGSVRAHVSGTGARASATTGARVRFSAGRKLQQSRRSSHRHGSRGVLFADRGLQHPQTAQEGAGTQTAREHIALKSDAMHRTHYNAAESHRI